MIRFGSAPFLECSSKGDRRFSAFYARVRSVKAAKMFAPYAGMHGLSIEGIYQASKKFADGATGLSWQVARGCQPMNVGEVKRVYRQLWRMYIEENPELLEVLCQASGLSDMFGQPGHACQAEELWLIRERELKRRERDGRA